MRGKVTNDLKLSLAPNKLLFSYLEKNNKSDPFQQSYAFFKTKHFRALPKYFRAFLGSVCRAF
jgi:hypothetical protein